MTPSFRGAAWMTALALVLCGCASTQPDTAAPAVQHATPPPPPPAQPAPPPAPTEVPDGDNDGPPQPRAQSTLALENASAGAPARKSLTATAQLSGLPDHSANANTMVAHFIDVGQGDATLLEFSCGAILIDTGGEQSTEVSGRKRLVAYLEEFFAKRADLARTLELVVLSHPHVDHTDGVQGILDMQPAVNIMNVLDNGTASGNNSGISGQKKLQKYAADTGAGYVGLAESDIPTVAGVTNKVIDPINCRRDNVGVNPKITAIWGRVDENSTWANNANNDSVVLRVDFGKASFLFTGDLQSEGIAAMLDAYSPDPKILNIDVLKVGHHGSHNATTKAFMKTSSPKIAVAQSGDSTLSHDDHTAWVYGHPNIKAINLIVDPMNGVSDTRAPRQFPVGVSGRPPNSTKDPVFTTMRIDRALYDNGWDGNIAITAHSDGKLEIQTEF